MKGFLSLSLIKLKWSAEGILKTYEQFVYGDIHYITNYFCEKCAENSCILGYCTFINLTFFVIVFCIAHDA